MTHVSAKRYVIIWAALVALTLVSWLFSLASLGAADVVIAISIAAVKSTLVLLFFMHLVEARLASGLVPLISAGFVFLLVSLVTADVATRHTFPPAVSPPLRAR